MLPIDEHAKNADRVLLCCVTRGELYYATLAKWVPNPDDEVEGGDWIEVPTGLNCHGATHYLPASWVEQAGAMREALAGVLHYEIAHVGPYATQKREAAQQVLAATEWPEVKR